MRIIAKGTLRDYWLSNPLSETPLLEWYDTVRNSAWQSPNDVRKTFGNASIVANSRVVFNIKGNDYRLVAKIDYKYQLAFVIWVGTHKEYDRIDVTKVKYNG